MKKNLYLMYAIAFLQGMVFYAPIATLYRQAQGVSIFQITLIESISFALCILLEIPWGIAADKIGYRHTMIVCCVLYFLSKLVFWQASGFTWFLAERILLSIVQSGFSGVDSSILYLSCHGRNSQKVFGIYNSMGMAGLLSAAVIFSVFIKDRYSLAALLTVIGYGMAALFSFLLTEVRGNSSEKFHPQQFISLLKEELTNHELLLFLTAVALFSETHQTITVFLNQLQYTRAGFHDTGIGILYIIAAGIGMCGSFSFFFTRRRGMRFSITAFCFSAVFSCFILAVCTSKIFSVFGILMLRFSNTLFQPVQTELQHKLIHSGHRATMLSMNAMFMDCIAIITNLSFGALSEVNLPASFLFGSGICLAALLLLQPILRKRAF